MGTDRQAGEARRGETKRSAQMSRRNIEGQRLAVDGRMQRLSVGRQWLTAEKDDCGLEWSIYGQPEVHSTKGEHIATGRP